MRILVGANVFPDPNSGAAGTVYQTNRALRELGHQVDEIWSPDLGRKIEHGNLHNLLELPYRYKEAVAQKTLETDYDVIQLSQPHAYLAAIDHQRHARPGIFVNRSHGLECRSERTLRFWHKEFGVKPNRFPRILFSPVVSRLLNRHLLKISRVADGIILPCREDREFLLENTGVDSERVQVIHHGVPDGFLHHRAMPMGSRIRRWLFVGQFAFFKGPNVLAAAVGKLLARYPDVTLTWVCSREHHQEARDLLRPSVVPQVRFVDWQAQDQLMQVYDTHGIFLFPSLFEGAGKSALEAMSRGMCVVTSETSGMKDYIENGRSGLLIETGSVEGFVAAVQRLMRDAEACQRMGLEARSAAAQYSWRRCAQESVEFYRLLQAKKTAPEHPSASRTRNTIPIERCPSRC